MPIHVRAEPGEVAPVVLLVGDPARATRAAEFLDQPNCYNQFRGLLGYTGLYHGRRVSVQTTMMGCPSAAIVCEELAALGARTLIRLGTCGAIQSEIVPTDLIIVTAACPLDGTTAAYLEGDRFAPAATFRVVQALVAAAASEGIRYHVGTVVTEDALYALRSGYVEKWAARGALGQEMEASAVFTIAALRRLEAGCILIASNAAGQHERLPDRDLMPAIDRMIRIGLDAGVALSPD